MNSTDTPILREKLIYELSDHYETLFPFKIQKISLNAGMSCPNRDGTKAYGGCTYCNNSSFSPSYVEKQRLIREQIQKGLNSYKIKQKTRFFAYFQSYTNTFSSIDELRLMYDEAIEDQAIIGLVVGTRPDCLSDEVLDLLEEFSKKVYVVIEIGIESTLNRTLDLVNRCHSYEESLSTIDRIHQRGIKIGAHIMLGLPGESRSEILEHADKLSTLPITYLKIHQLQIVKHTMMARQYEDQPDNFDLFSLEEYIQFAADFISRIREDIVIERVTSTCPPHLLVAPKWGGFLNADVMSSIKNNLRDRKLSQGCNVKSLLN